MVYGKFGEDWSKSLPIVLKMARNGIFARRNCETTGLKLGMHTLPDSGSNLGWIPLGHTSSFWCVRQKKIINLCEPSPK